MKKLFQVDLATIFTETALRSIWSISCDVREMWVVDVLSPLSVTGTKRARDFWSKSALQLGLGFEFFLCFG